VQVLIRRSKVFEYAQGVFVESAHGDGTRKQREKQEGLWIVHTDLASAPGHLFYQRLNELLEAESFDKFV